MAARTSSTAVTSPVAPDARTGSTSAGSVTRPSTSQPETRRAVPSSDASASVAAAGVAVANVPANSSPVEPSSETASPSASTRSPTCSERAPSSMRSAPAPTTHVVPSARATTAAWLVEPPVAVTIPAAAIMPCRSAGLVTERASTTGVPPSAISLARSGSSTRVPDTWPGQAPMPAVSSRPDDRAWATSSSSNPGRWTWRTCADVTARSAAASPTALSSRRSEAIRTAASGVRFALRTCSRYSVDRSTVNSMSSTSPCERSRSAPTARSSVSRSGGSASVTGSGVRVPATTSSPWLCARYSPNSPGSPVTGLRVNTTPDPESSERFPNTIDCTTTAVPIAWSMPWCSR